MDEIKQSTLLSILEQNEKKKNTALSEQISKSNIIIVERGNIDISNTQVHDRSLTWLGTGTLIKMWRG